MTVKDVFELRRQGRIEEAYEAIRPMYAVHKGKYTTLAMFWVGSDVLKKRLGEGLTTEAVAIFRALLRVLPSVEDRDGRCRDAMRAMLMRMAREVSDFRVLDYLCQFPISDEDWLVQQTSTGFMIPPFAPRLLERAFLELQQSPTVDDALLVMPLLERAMAHDASNQEHQRYMSIVRQIINEASANQNN